MTAKLCTSHRARRFHRHGGAILETCLVMPIIIMVSFGMVDYGYCMYMINVFQGAAQAGARAAITDTATNSNVTATVSTMMSAAGVASGSYTVTTNPASISGTSAGTSITVTVSSTWGTIGTKLLPSSMGGLTTTKAIIGASVMQRQQ